MKRCTLEYVVEVTAPAYPSTIRRAVVVHPLNDRFSRDQLSPNMIRAWRVIGAQNPAEATAYVLSDMAGYMGTADWFTETAVIVKEM